MFIFLSSSLLNSQILLEVVQKERIMRGSQSRGPVYVHPVLAGLEFEQVCLYKFSFYFLSKKQ
jgi:hypothetical protein